MIEIEITKVRHSQVWTGYRVTAKGHSGMAEYGYDIVCAAVSSLLQTLADKATEVGRAGLGNSKVEHRDGVMTIELEADDMMQETAAAWVEFVQQGIAALCGEYPENVQLSECILTEDGEEEEDPDLPEENGGEGHRNLQQFAEGGAAGAGGAAAAPAAGEAAPAAPEMTPAQERLARRSGALKAKAAKAAKAEAAAPEAAAQEPEEKAPAQEPEEGAEEQSGEEKKQERTPEERRRAFGEMMQGEYADLFAEMMDHAVATAVEQMEGNPQMQALRQALRDTYGMDVDDMDALVDAVQHGRVKNEAYYEDLAQQRGVSVKTAKELDRMESELRRANAENERRQRLEQEMQRQQRVAKIREGWEAEAEVLRQQYPDFVLDEVLANPQVGELMRRGVKLGDAYRAAYFDHIMEQTTAQTAQKVERGVAARIQQRSSRPGENGTHPGGAAVTKVDVASMTRRQREELARRARRGERIVL